MDLMGRTYSTNWANNITYMILMETPEGKRPQRRPRRRWVNDIKLILETWDGVVWTGLFWLRIGTNGELL
jgi:hypothetical protein